MTRQNFTADLDKVDGSSFINITSVLYNIVKLRRQTLASRQSPPSSAPLNHAIPTESATRTFRFDTID
jgi:hypothetical protein